MSAHIHAWRSSGCSCGASRCQQRNDTGWRCTDAEPHDTAHHYADGTTSPA